MRIQRLLLLLLLPALPAVAAEYSVGETRLEFKEGRGAFQLTIPGAPSCFSGERLWDIRFFDEEARKANTRTREIFNVGCNEQFVQSKVFLDRPRAKLRKTGFNRETGVFTAEYRHPDAIVTLQIRLMPEEATLKLIVTNQSDLPINSIFPVPELAFRLNDRKLLLPAGCFPAFEAEGCNNCYYWGSSAAWNGFLLPAPDGKVFAVDCIPAPDYRCDPTINHIDGDRETGKKLRFSLETICYLRKGETRETPEIRLRGFPNLRSWADRYIADCFPEGLKKLQEKYPADLWNRFRQASWAAGDGAITPLRESVELTPGRILLQNGNYMHPLKGSPLKVQLDSFPNHFPVNSFFGTDAEFGQLIRKVDDNGGIYVPRTSFFYWVKGSDFDLEHGVRNSAIVRPDGTACTARWGNMPGYIVSPSDPVASKKRKEIFDRFRRLGAAGYFTNVICAVNAHSIRYDFHKDAPAPDRLYAQIEKMFRQFGTGTPLFCEGFGGIWLLPHLAGICWNMHDNRYSPDNLPSSARYLLSPRLSWSPGLMLSHEYVANLPHNLNTKDATNTITRLTHSLVNGFLLKVGLLPKEKLSRQSVLWLRTCAIFSQEVTSRLIGRRLADWKETGEVVTADYSGSIVTANFSDKGIPWSDGRNRGILAPEGFGFRNDAEGVTAGYFSELNGVTFTSPVLLLASRKPSGETRLYAPLETEALRLVWNGAPVEIPAYPSRLERTVRGVTLSVNGKCYADPEGTAGYLPPALNTGLKTAPAAPRTGTVPLLIDWDSSKPLPPELKLSAPSTVTPEGIHLAGRNGTLTFRAPAPFTRRFHAELIVRYDRMPGNPDYFGVTPFMTAKLPAGSYYWDSRTVEFGYTLKADAFFLANITGSTGHFFWTDIRNIALEPGKYYHILLIVDGGRQTFSVNGIKRTIPFSGTMRPTPLEWQIGSAYDPMTISLIRFGGE